MAKKKGKKKTDTSLFRVGKNGPLQRSMPNGTVRTVDPSAVSRNERRAKQSRARAHNSSLTNKQRLSAAQDQVSYMMGAAEGRGRAKLKQPSSPTKKVAPPATQNKMADTTVEVLKKDRKRRNKSVNQPWKPKKKK